MEYIIILVDESSRSFPVPFQNDNLKVDIFIKGTQMVGLRFKETRPTLIIDTIQERSLRGSSEKFQHWYESEVLRNKTPKTQILKRRPS